MKQLKILVVCTKMGARSSIAKAYLSHFGGPGLSVQSASFDEGRIPAVITEIMTEAGFEFTGQRPRSVFNYKENNEQYDYVLSICDESTNEICPVLYDSIEALFSESARIIKWDIPDISAVEGEPEEVKKKLRRIREKIAAKVRNFLAALNQPAGLDSR